MFIKKWTYGGFDWHDSAQYLVQLTVDGDYDIADPRKAIITDIRKRFPYVDGQKLVDAILEKKSYQFGIRQTDARKTAFCEQEDVSDEKELFFCGDIGEFNGATMQVIESFGFGQNVRMTTYQLEDLDGKGIQYMVTEQFLSLGKGIPLVMRFYHEPFSDRKDAVDYWEKMRLHDDVCSRKEILVFDQTVSEQEWFCQNLEAISLMRKTGKNVYDPSFCVDVNLHMENLRKISS